MNLLRAAGPVREEPDGHGFDVTGLRAAALPGTPGYLTGESLAAQGIETTMPNLPDLDLPPLAEAAWTLRVRFPAQDTVRLTLAPAGAAVLDDDGRWLGIVVDPRPAPVAPHVTAHADTTVLETDVIRVRVGHRPFRIAIEDARTGRVRLRTAERLRQVAGFPMAPAVLSGPDGTTLHLELGTDEDITGFGEHFGRLVRNGQQLTLRVTDALGTGTGMAYKPVPVWQSSAGYLGFLNTGAVVTADVGHLRPSVLGLTVDDEALDLYVISGEDPAGRLGGYTALTGRAQVPPLWAFGYWMGRCRYHSREEMLNVGRGMRTHQVPCDVLHLDPDWLVVDRLNTDFIWNSERFGDRRSFIDALAALGLRLSVWELPYLDPASPRYQEAADKRYLVVGDDGQPVAVTGTPSPDGRPRALVDFTNPDARAWWQQMHEDFLADRVAVFKTDFGEGLPDEARLADGTPANHAHNLYPLRYNAAVSEVTARRTGRAPLVWGRSGWAGSHRYPGQWSGDAESTVAGMQATLRGGLSYALCAPGLWSHDIGGFFGPELTPQLYVRWTQFGALSPLMRAHGLRPREPWAFGDEALRIARDWIRLRYSLLPYLWQVVHESLGRGLPVLRPLGLHYPDDEVARSRDDSFLLGSDLLVVPVFDDGPGPVRRRYYLPAGRWVDLVTGAVRTGGGFITEDVELARIPLLARDGALLPRVDVDVRNTDDLHGRVWTLHTVGEVAGERTLVGFDGTPTRITVAGSRVSGSGSTPVAPEVVRHG